MSLCRPDCSDTPEKGQFLPSHLGQARPGGYEVKKALIIAAGMGLRFGSKTNHRPKPLIPVAGVPLILRTIYSAYEAGINSFVVVTGYLREELESFLKKNVRQEIEIQFVYNEKWQRPNGWSVYCGRDFFTEEEPFFLMMSDHIFDKKILHILKQNPLEDKKCRLAVDFNPERVPDLQEATKVFVDGSGYIRKIGKTIETFNGVDTGLFLCCSSLFTVLEEAFQEGRETLSDGIQKLADKQMMESVNIERFFWQDVDNEDDLKRAESYLFDSLKSPTDSWITKQVNRKISISITKKLALFPKIMPNDITLFNFFLGLLGGLSILKGNYLSVLVGSFLFLASSIFDGCDGELARLRFQKSSFGAWLDVTTDNITHWFLFTALTVTSVKNHGIFPYAILGTSLVLSSFISFVLTWFHPPQSSHKGLLFSESTLTTTLGTSSRSSKMVDRMANRDFAYILTILALVNHAEWFLLLGGLGAPIFASLLYRNIAHGNDKPKKG